MLDSHKGKWPRSVWLVRHGQSAGNVARDKAESAGLPFIDIATRDMDVPLSSLGYSQADAVGRWIGTLPPDSRPTVLLCSPYRRAAQTAQRIADLSRLGDDVVNVIDERLREKELDCSIV